MHIQRKAATLLIFTLAIILAVVYAHTAAAQSSEISGFIWNDKNTDGLFQKDEPLLAGVTVTLVKKEGSSELPAGSTKTGNDGRYRFAGIDTGEYKLSAELPEDAIFTTPVEGGSTALPASGNVSSTDWFTLAQGEVSSDKYIIGCSKYNSYLLVYAFEDSNANGGRFSTEPMLKGVQIDLVYSANGSDTIIASRITDADGIAAFRGLTPAEYRVSVTLPSPYVVGPLGQKFNTFYNCVVPTESNTGLTEPFVIPAKGSIGMAVGAVKTGSVKGAVWFDKNVNGKQDSSEQGYQGAVVLLESPSMKITRTVKPAPDGTYIFTQVQPGAYQLSIHLPDDVMFTLPGGDSLFSDASFQQTSDVSVTEEKTSQVRPVGVMPVTSFELIAFHDVDFNGIQDESDPAFAGAKVKIYRNGGMIAQVETGESGAALIPVIRGGDVSVQCVLPDGQVFTVDNQADSSYLTSPAAVSDLTRQIYIPDAERMVLKAGITVPASVAGRVFEDADNNGILDPGELFMPGITVQAINAKGVPVRETVTGSDGRYMLDSLLPAAHTIRFVLKDPYIISIFSMTGADVENAAASQTPEYGETATLALLPGQGMVSIDAGIFKAGVVSGFINLNANQDDLETSEGGLPGVLVELLDESGMPVSDYSRGRTNEDGFYYIKGVLPGLYSLRYTMPDNAAFSLPMIDEPVYQSEVFEIVTGADKTMPPLGAVFTGSISGAVWLDANANGIMETDEAGLAGVSFSLKSGRTGLTNNALSQGDGRYMLASLRPDTYALTVTLPDGMVFTDSGNAPVPAVPSNISGNTITLAMGQHLDESDIGTAEAASMDGIMFYDANNNAVFEDGETVISGAELTIADVSGSHQVTVATGVDGGFNISSIIPGNYVLSVKTDSDCFLSDGISSEFADGAWKLPVPLGKGEQISGFPVGVVRYASIHGAVWSMDGSTSGIGARHVSLFKVSDDTSPLLETETGSDGIFAFSNLKPGQYYLSMAIPGEYRFAREADTKARASRILSDAPGAGGEGSSAVFDVPMGGQMTGCDIGIGALGKLGDIAWLDTNKNGMQDGGEPGMPGIVVTLYQYGVPAAETTTDLYGRYLFTGLFPGVYEVTVTMHKELKTTVTQSEFPLVASILPEANETTATAQVVVPSGGRNMNCDFGFILKVDGKYPAIMDQIPTTDWSPINIK